jgi:hypothetical protein
MNKRGYPELINIAAEMARGDGLPSDASEDHLPRRRRSYWLAQLEKAQNQSREWAIRVRDAADKTPLPRASTGDPQT